jgi:hypothetical protein
MSIFEPKSAFQPGILGSAAVLLIVLAMLFAIWRVDQNADSGAVEKTSGVVHFVISFNGHHPENQRHEFQTDYEPGMTVFSAMQAARQNDQLKFQSKGSGETAFITSIDGVSNLGAANDNWIYRVNGKVIQKSSGVCEIAPYDEIEWRLGQYEIQQ